MVNILHTKSLSPEDSPIDKSIGRYKENPSSEITDHCNSVLGNELGFFLATHPDLLIE